MHISDKKDDYQQAIYKISSMWGSLMFLYLTDWGKTWYFRRTLPTIYTTAARDVCGHIAYIPVSLKERNIHRLYNYTKSKSHLVVWIKYRFIVHACMLIFLLTVVVRDFCGSP